MPSVNAPQPITRPGRSYWRSLDELADTPQFHEFLSAEFPNGSFEGLLNGNVGTRRHFLQIMGASLAMAGMGMSGCRRWPEETIEPYTSRPVGRTPGVSVAYATSMETAGVSIGLLATSYDGRPLKLEGNPEHPFSLGAADIFAQAGILDLYDPDRSRSVRRAVKGSTEKGQESCDSTWDAFLEWSGSQDAPFWRKGGEGFCILSEATASPSVKTARSRLQRKYPKMKWFEYEPVNADTEVEGAIEAFGSPLRMIHALNRAKTIVSLDADFLGMHPASIKYTRDYATGRRIDDPEHPDMSRLYVFESGVSLTGANADHRIPIRRVDIGVIAAKLAVRLVDNADPSLHELANLPIETILSESELDAMLDRVVSDLQPQPQDQKGRDEEGGHEERGHAMVMAGAAQPAEVHVLVHAINAAIGAFGKTVTAVRLPSDQLNSLESLRSLVDQMRAGHVSTLLILGGNPVYNAPADLKFAEALREVNESIHLSSHVDETSSACTWHIPRAHFLECWGDGRAYDGTVSISQPLILPLVGGRSLLEVLTVLSSKKTNDAEIVKQTCHEIGGDSFSDSQWRKALHDGVLAGTSWPSAELAFRANTIGPAAKQLLKRPTAAGMELIFQADPTLLDGRFANNGWLQELPDPLTKLTWDNGLLVSVAKAKELEVTTGDMVQISTGGVKAEVPILIMPGHHDQSATFCLGYGRAFPGRVCAEAGFNAYPLRTTSTLWSASDLGITKTGRTYLLATTQNHHAIDVENIGGRSQQDRLPMLLHEATLEHYKQHPDFASHQVHVPHQLSMWEEKNLQEADHRWAMSIDLSSCTGCNACITACQAENNIPIVGKEEVIHGREMQWIRLDRYFRFEQDADGQYDAEKLARIALQPVTCGMCENAPCEQVCPVGATVHNQDGLNLMVYNRCIGTRYCSNNCPYKVRRFNFFDYHCRPPYRESPGELLEVQPDYYTKGQAEPDELLQLQLNPEVTVRMRGVMEKCNFCLQRVMAEKIKAKNEWIQKHGEDERGDDEKGEDKKEALIPDGTIQTACQQTCPAQAIVFGDLNDPESQVARLHNDSRTYGLLEELNLKTRVKYLAKITNPAGSTSAVSTLPGSVDDHAPGESGSSGHADGGGAVQ